MRWNNIKWNIDVIGKTKVWFTISGIIILAGLIAMFTMGLNWGLDFTGGTVMEFDLHKTVTTSTNTEITNLLKSHGVKESQVKAIGTNNTHVSISTPSLDDKTRTEVIDDLKSKYKLTDKDLVSSQNVGAALGKEMQVGTIFASLVAAALMLIYIGFRFNFEMGAAAVLALIHDILIMLAAYALLRIVVNTPFVAAILTVFGYSINDTIVIFDRIRDNIKLMRKSSYAEIANVSINETMTRSINTVMTVLLMLILMYFFGPASIKSFALPLLIGIASGAYSSIFIASPLWVIFKDKEGKNRVGNKTGNKPQRA
ncbi:protein translocase subunit SecF [Thermoanaerobacterium sp. RBIITD]|uniref:protein translocase subunit SecF n=1 Tax=Thermoanaerobacterium sp. RBIITD TaxID=1550240 RepID=UPI000BB6D74E|nr:protein translocase subunit SecF [Thermoanaerobacterium sp. RBIITD]SNX52650.1 preprotein translocase subunit SecF [Thermoanaerobacterium sp. RBIITD]